MPAWLRCTLCCVPYLHKHPMLACYAMLSLYAISDTQQHPTKGGHTHLSSNAVLHVCVLCVCVCVCVCSQASSVLTY